MGKTKPKPKSPFEGRWRIVSMEMWDEDFINADASETFPLSRCRIVIEPLLVQDCLQAGC